MTNAPCVKTTTLILGNTKVRGNSRTELAAVWPPTSEVCKQAGHHRKTPLQSIRERCLDCCGFKPSEVRLCEAVNCPSWPFRAGTHPYLGHAGKSPLPEGDFPQEMNFKE